MADARPISSWASAPFGRVGYRLGWRWLFFFTFPIPYHPGIARALPLLLLAWLAWLALGPGEVGWTGPLWAALILAVPLSVPFLQWILFAFGLHLIQALMVPASMLLLGLAVAKGEEPLWLAPLPILFFVGYAAAAAAGRLRIRAWQADNRKVDDQAGKTGPLPPLLLKGRYQAEGHAAHLLECLDLPAVHCESRSGDRPALRVADPELIAWLGEVQDMRLDLFRMTKRSGGDGHEHGIVYLPADAPAGAWAIEPAAPPPPRPFVRGLVGGVQASAPGHPPLTYWYGRPAPFSWLLGFYFLIRLRLGSEARFAPEAGFIPGRPRPLGKNAMEQDGYLALAAALRLDGPPPPPFTDPAELRRRVEALLEARLEPELAALDRLIASPASWMTRPLDTLLRLPHFYAARAAELVATLRTARDAEHVPAAVLLAQLIAALPNAAFQGIGDDLLAVLNSKLLAGQRQLSEAEAARSPRPFVGFRLLIRVPQLYLRLPHLGERARPLLLGLARLFPRAEPIQQALAKLDGAPAPGASL